MTSLSQIVASNLGELQPKDSDGQKISVRAWAARLHLDEAGRKQLERMLKASNSTTLDKLEMICSKVGVPAVALLTAAPKGQGRRIDFDTADLRLLRSLHPPERVRVRDFIAGLQASRPADDAENETGT